MSRILLVRHRRSFSALRESESGAAYDRKAAIYDAVFGWPPYHRIV